MTSLNTFNNTHIPVLYIDIYENLCIVKNCALCNEILQISYLLYIIYKYCIV